jgi:hypothetical protein
LNLLLAILAKEKVHISHRSLNSTQLFTKIELFWKQPRINIYPLERAVDQLLINADSDKFVFREVGIYASLTRIETN